MAALRRASQPSDLPGLLAEARPGDRIEVAAASFSSPSLLLRAAAPPAQPIVVAAAEPGRTLLLDTPEIRLEGSGLQLEGFHFPAAAHLRLSGTGHTLRGLSLEEAPTPSPRETKWISLYGEGHTVEHCYLAGKKTPGATLVVWLSPDRPSGQHRIRHNHFGHRPPLGQNGGETLRIGDSATSLLTANCLVEANLFARCNGEIEVISNKSCGNVYHANTFRACAGTLTLRHGNACRVVENLFLGEDEPESGGVRIIGEDHWVESNYFVGLRGRGFRAAISLVQGIVNTPLNGYAQVKRAVVSANGIWDCAEAIAWSVPARGASLAPVECWLASNLIDSPQRPPFDPLGPPRVGPRWRIP